MTPSHPTQMDQQSGRGSEHTRGPWFVGRREEQAIVTGSPEGMVLYRGSPDFKKADARLIAAAPDLLAAVRRLLPKPFTGNPSDKELIEFWRAERELGRGEADDVLAAYAAIAKATGARA